MGRAYYRIWRPLYDKFGLRVEGFARIRRSLTSIGALPYFNAGCFYGDGPGKVRGVVLRADATGIRDETPGVGQQSLTRGWNQVAFALGDPCAGGRAA